jgi:hypothetical protein
VKRRTFISLIGGAVATWPLTARAQQPAVRLRRIGVLNPFAGMIRTCRQSDGVPAGAGKARWSNDRNVRIDYRWGGADSGRIRAHRQQRRCPYPTKSTASSSGPKTMRWRWPSACCARRC